jgi:cell fate (sporulation/competence/biofilm development) regulator YmcA (YheA/YmcA/DUF963 family)
MSTIQVWNSVEELASEWAKSPLVEQLTANLPANNPADSGVPEALRNLDAGTSIVSTQPLLTAMWEPLAEGVPLVQLDVPVRQFLRSVAPIGHALEVWVGWIRSRLPRYPLIPAPQLAARGYRRCEEYGARLSWRGQVLQAGLQFESTPPTGMAALLQLPTSEGINDATVSLAAALADTEEWREFERLSAELNDDDRLALRQAIQRINELLAPAKVNEFEPERMARRERLRIDQVDAVIQTLGGRPREFADSFKRVDDLIDLVAIEVLGQIVTRGAPIELATVDDLEIDGANVRFVNSSQAYLPAGSLTRLPDPLVPEVVIVDSWAITSDPATGSVISHHGRRLPGSGAAFTAQ